MNDQIEKAALIAAALGGKIERTSVISEGASGRDYSGSAHCLLVLSTCRFWLDFKGDRLAVTSNYPHDRDGVYHSQREFDPAGAPFGGIRCSALKSVEKIVADIRRRFLPRYEPLYALAVAYCDWQDTYLDTVKSNEQHVITAVRYVKGLTVSFVGRDNISFVIHVPVRNAKALIDFVRGLE